MSAPRDRGPDPHADPLVASVMRAAGAVPARDCPEAEVLALYAEQELSSDERGPVEAHVADCGRCQATVAAFVRSAPEPGGSEGAGSPVALPWWASWRWLVPVASVAGVVALAVWLGRGPAEPLAPASDVTASATPSVATAPAPDAAARDAAARAANAQVLGERVTQPLADTRVPAALPRQAAAPSPAKNSADTRVDARSAETTRETLAKAESSQLEESRQRMSPALAQNAPAASTAGLAAPPDAPATSEAPAPPPATEAQGRGETAAGRRLADVAESSAQALGWRVRRGVVERSADQGKTWTRTASPTTDRVTSVSATNARVAVVTSETGARFATTDGGATWRSLP